MYSEAKVRELSVKYREKHGIKETCEAFEISATALNNRVKRYKETGGLANKALNRKHKKIAPEKLLKDVEEHRMILTMKERKGSAAPRQ
jgi:transposase